jgi:hypothetical protein
LQAGGQVAQLGKRDRFDQHNICCFLHFVRSAAVSGDDHHSRLCQPFLSPDIFQNLPSTGAGQM